MITDYEKIETMDMPETMKYMHDGIVELLTMAKDENIAHVDTPTIEDYIGTSYGGHVNVMLFVMREYGLINGYKATRSHDGRWVNVWSIA
jgi:hypothetical protein